VSKDKIERLKLSVLADETPTVRETYTGVVDQYAERMQEGDRFPPIVAFLDGEGAYHVADGFHRIAAARKIGATDIEAIVIVGTKSDALWHASGPTRPTASGFVPAT